ncbi:four-helix bundle copper-binding protein [Xenophilus aerolatus]|nr:four-helix bundle copper-binding protein [Xenophilus aerolatus]
MSHEKYTDCIEACNACAVACNHCAASCLAEEDVKMMAKCIALDMDCAGLCQLAAAAMARDSAHAGAICRLCAEVCKSCGDECSGHDAQHCRDCAQACYRCAEACLAMAD